MTDEELFDAARAEGSGERLLHDVVKRFSYAARVCRTCSGSAFIMRK